MDRFFDGAFLTFGLEVIAFAEQDQEDRLDPLIYVFPRMTKVCSTDHDKWDLNCLYSISAPSTNSAPVEKLRNTTPCAYCHLILLMRKSTFFFGSGEDNVHRLESGHLYHTFQVHSTRSVEYIGNTVQADHHYQPEDACLPTVHQVQTHQEGSHQHHRQKVLRGWLVPLLHAGSECGLDDLQRSHAWTSKETGAPRERFFWHLIREFSRCLEIKYQVCRW